MLDSIKRFFDTHLAPDSAEAKHDPEHAIRLAVAVLLTEIAESDHQRLPEEEAALLDAVQNHFGLDDDEAGELIALAEAEHAESTDYFQFTSLINKTYTHEQKIKVIEALWKIAFADQELHKYEEHVIRRLADLIHVPHKDFIATKHRVLNAGIKPD